MPYITSSVLWPSAVDTWELLAHTLCQFFFSKLVSIIPFLMEYSVHFPFCICNYCSSPGSSEGDYRACQNGEDGGRGHFVSQGDGLKPLYLLLFHSRTIRIISGDLGSQIPDVASMSLDEPSGVKLEQESSDQLADQPPAAAHSKP